jgi:hypothetical protein
MAGRGDGAAGARNGRASGTAARRSRRPSGSRAARAAEPADTTRQRVAGSLSEAAAKLRRVMAVLDPVRHTDTGSPERKPRVEPTGVCPECGRGTYGGADFCKARRCPHYAPIWARDQQRKVFANLTAYSDGDGHAVMFTPTAPGVGSLPWDEDHCRALGDHKHSGNLGCRVEPQSAREWNDTCSERWRRLNDRAARLTAKQTGRRPHLLTRAFEMQKRGVLHVHAVIARGTWADKHAADVYGRHLARLAVSYGFGHVDEPTGRARAARESAAYISSYLSSKRGGKRTLGETVLSDELPRSVIHVSTRLTMQTCVTMRSLRLRRLIHVRWDTDLPFTEQRSVEQLLAAFPGSELVAVDDSERGPPQ